MNEQHAVDIHVLRARLALTWIPVWIGATVLDQTRDRPLEESIAELLAECELLRSQAHRAGIRRIILPERNEADTEDIPEDVRAELEIIPAKRIDDVLAAALEAEQTVPKGENYVVQEV